MEQQKLIDMVKAAVAASQSEYKNFGISKSGDGRAATKTLEDAFQTTLCNTLNQLSINSDWQWLREVSYPTTSLRNESRIDLDILGVHPIYESVGIELKYVTRTIDQNGDIGKPSDIYSFPYDVLKDCLKLELVASSTKDMGNTYSPLQNKGQPKHRRIGLGLVIGLTNESLYWSPDCLIHRRGSGFAWALNYLKTIHANYKGIVEFGPQVIQTCSARSQLPTANAIYKQRRHHLSLGQNWSGTWLSYAQQSLANPFKFLLLSSDFLSDENDYRHSWRNPSTVPFGSSEMRNNAAQIAKCSDYSDAPITP